MKLTPIGSVLLLAASCLVSAPASAQMPPREKIDSNGDGIVDFSEMQAIHPGLTVDEFNKIDANSDGQLMSDELRAAHMAKFMERLDTDGDGAISREEMESFGPPRFDSSEKFQQFDSNGDGKLGQEEFKAMHEEMRQKHEAMRKREGRPHPEAESD